MSDKQERRTPEQKEHWFSLMCEIDKKLCACCRTVPCIKEILQAIEFKPS